MRKIEVCLAGGLGNQLFQYAAAISASDQNDELIFNWAYGNTSLNESGFPQILDFSLPRSVSTRRSEPGLLKKKTWNLLLRLSTRKRPNRFINLFQKFAGGLLWKQQSLAIPQGVGFDEKFRYRSGNNLQIGYFQSYLWMENVGVSLIMRDISPVAPTPDSYWKQLAEEEHPLVIQIRIGDYVGEPKIGVLPNSYWDSTVRSMWSSGKYKKIWLFSDSTDAALSVLKGYRNEIRIMDRGDISPAHIIQMMRYGHGYIISNSTFGWWGAFLTYTPNAVVVYPEPWFKELPSPKNLCPQTWDGYRSWA